MRRTQFLLIALLVVVSARTALGHGFSLGLSGNQLVASSGASNPHLFFGELADVAGTLRIDHGGAGSSLFGSGKSLSFDVFTPLFYSDGSGDPAEPAPAAATMRIASLNLVGSIDITGATGFTAGYAITGNTNHEFRWSLLGATPLPEGVYGLGYKVKGSPVGGAPYDPTDLLVATFYTPGFFPGDNPLDPDSPLSLANGAIFSAANTVPEPSSVVLAALGLATLVGYGWRRHGRRAVS